MKTVIMENKEEIASLLFYVFGLLFFSFQVYLDYIMKWPLMAVVDFIIAFMCGSILYDKMTEFYEMKKDKELEKNACNEQTEPL